MPTSFHSSFVSQLLEPVSAALNPEAARKLLRIRYDRKTRQRVAQLARKCNEGELSDEERLEYESFVIAGEIVALLQAQSRTVLAEAPV
ncbi:MAG: hypothetical protein U0796_04165 [Gemmatales bacterium]